MRALSFVLQGIGCAAIVIAAFVLGGTGIGLAVGGVLAVLVGVVLERES